MPRKANHRNDRELISRFEEIINVGPAIAGVFESIGLKTPQDLIGKDPLRLYQHACRANQKFYDPCVLDVFIATVDYMNGNHPKPWWKYTTKRKRQFADDVENARNKYA